MNEPFLEPNAQTNLRRLLELHSLLSTIKQDVKVDPTIKPTWDDAMGDLNRG